MRNFIFLSSLCLFIQISTAQEAHIAVEAYSGKVLSAENSTVKRPIASLTKIITSVVALDWAQAKEIDPSTHLIQVPAIASELGGTSPLNLIAGEILTLRDALYAALLASDNVAALSIGHHVGIQLLQSRNQEGDPLLAFIGEMNRFAAAVNASQTTFGNSSGQAPNLSTAADVAKMSIHAMRRNSFSFIVRQESREISIDSNEGTRTLTINNTNELLGEPGISGIKTGTTSAAGPCLATCVDLEPLQRTKADGTIGVTPRRLIVVVLNSPDRYGNTRDIIGASWKHYDSWLASGALVKDRAREILATPLPK